jgi:Adenylate kinase
LGQSAREIERVVTRCSRRLQLLQRRIEEGRKVGEKGFVLDGFPRTVAQAERLLQGDEEVQLVVNLQLREEVLIEKCIGRRICRKCGKGWNLADIYLPAEGTRPEIVMPPLDPPADCLAFMEQRSDDKEEVSMLWLCGGRDPRRTIGMACQHLCLQADMLAVMLQMSWTLPGHVSVARRSYGGVCQFTTSKPRLWRTSFASGECCWILRSPAGSRRHYHGLSMLSNHT